MNKQSRKKIPIKLEAKVLVSSARRCCLCEYIDSKPGPHRGQIAHLNQDPSDIRFGNLVFLCFRHHDEFDSSTSQSKGLTISEVKDYRSRLYKNISQMKQGMDDALINNSTANTISNRLKVIANLDSERYGFLNNPWRSIEWPEEIPILYPFKSPNNADGVCLVERIHIPTGQTVIICSEAPGNPGISVMNAIEYVVTQVCAKYDIDPHNVICLEHYYDDLRSRDRWLKVTFDPISPEGLFQNPDWVDMDELEWQRLGLRPNQTSGDVFDMPSFVERR